MRIRSSPAERAGRVGELRDARHVGERADRVRGGDAGHDADALVELPLEIVEVEVGSTSLAAGKRIEQLKIPPSARLLSVMRNGKAEIAVGSTRLEAGDQVLADAKARAAFGNAAAAAAPAAAWRNVLLHRRLAPNPAQRSERAPWLSR